MITRTKRWTIGLLLFAAAAAVLVVILINAGVAERWMREQIITQIQQKTGTRVEMGGFHLRFWHLHAEIDNLTLHGLEAAGQPPLFHADKIDVSIRIISFFEKQIALDELIVERPQAAVEIDANGRSNMPVPRGPAGNRPWRETLFQLRIGLLDLRDGSVLYDNRTTPLTVQGQNFEFTLHYDSPVTGPDSYVGNLGWRQVRLASGSDVPFPFDLSAKFTLHRDAFEIDELILNALHTNINLRAELPSFARQDWNLRYRGRLSLADVRRITRHPTTPDGDADFSGSASYMAGEWTASGYYSSKNVGMPYAFFHDRAIATSGNFDVAKRRLVVPNLTVRALGGTVDGQLEMDFEGFSFRTKTRVRGASLAQVFDAVNNDEFTVRALHWDGSVDVDSVNTWNSNFLNFRTTGEMRWSPPKTLRDGMIPATAKIEFDYGTDNQVISISQGEISTPDAQLSMEGFMGETDSALDVNFRAEDLLKWDDFINAVRGKDAEPARVAGRVEWKGRLLGPIVGPTFAGHLDATSAQYNKLVWDKLAGDMEYSPDGFRLTKALLQRGTTSMTLDLSLQLDGDWSFLPSSTWIVDSRLVHANGDDIQAVLGTSYPVSGTLTGDLHGSGTRGAPMLDMNVEAAPIEAKGWKFDSLTGQLHWQQDELRLSRAALRQGSALVAGDILYRPDEQQAEFNLTGSGISLGNFAVLQTKAMPIGGELGFTLQGNGPVRAPVAHGDFHLMNLKFGAEVQGDLAGQLTSDGQNARATLESSSTHGKLNGLVTVGLAGNQPISGRLTLEQFDLDPIIVAALHLQQLTGHSSADGVFTISGALRQPDSIAVTADIARISLTYELVQLTNDQNIRFSYAHNEVRIEQARLHGPDTDLRLSGSARFAGDRALRLAASGGVNLGLLKGLWPDLNAQGRADMNVTVEGTMAQPRITGRATVRDASAAYADLPVGISKVNGDFVFDKNELLFEKVTAESGGGQITLTGSVSYGDGPLRYQIAMATSQIRIRYPVGMSWLAGGTLQFSGTSNATLVSGRVQVERLLFAQGVDVASFFASASESAPGLPSTSPLLQNLSFDVEAQTNPGARIEWTGAHVEVDGDVRLRGTFDRPLLLGNIHLLGGEMPFRGNTYELTRGDITFANPFRLDPVLNIQATSTINQYQVTIDFSGPASHLSLNYRSDPPLPDSDIVALLALGSTGEGSALRSQPGASQNYGATALLSEAISTGIGGRIEHLFGISQFRVDPFVAGTATESNAAARVTIQQQIAHNLVITYSTNAATSNQYQLIQVEYAVKRDLSVVFLRDINGTYGMDIKWVKHFK